MFRLITLLTAAFMLTGCPWPASGPTVAVVATPVTEKQVHDQFNGLGRELVKTMDRKMEGRLEALKGEINGHVTADGNLTRRDMASYNTDLVNSQKAMAGELVELAKIQKAFAERSEALGGAGGGFSGSAEVEIETTVNGVTIKAKGPAGSHTEVERMIREQQDRRERDREMLFLRGQVHHDRRRAEEMETRVTTLEYDVASAVAHLNVELSTLGSSFRERNALFEMRIKDIADRCGAVTVVFSPPIVVPPPSVVYPCQGRRIYYHPAKRCLHVWH